MPFALAERAAVAALFWARHARRYDDAIRGAVRGFKHLELQLPVGQAVSR